MLKERLNIFFNQVLQSLTRYLHHYLPPEVPKMKIQKFAIEYITCQVSIGKL